MTAGRFTVVSVTVSVEQDGALQPVEVAAAFDEVRSQDAARTVAKAIGDALAENLCRRLQHGEALA